MKRSPLLAAALLAAATLATAPALGREIYVSNEKGNSITIIDGDKLEVVETVPVGNRPRGIALSKDGRYLYVCASDDDTIESLDT
jgi:YVTN family beta-propeller protein